MKRNNFLFYKNQNSYFNSMINLFGSSLVSFLPLYEQSGVTARDLVHGYNGIYGGTYNLSNQLGIDNLRYLKTTAGWVDIFSSNLSSNFPYQEGSIVMWLKPLNSSMWADAAIGKPFLFLSGGSNNSISLAKNSSGAALNFRYFTTGNSPQVNTSATTALWTWTGWFSICMRWSVSNNKYTCDLNGAPLATTTGLASSNVGPLSSTNSALAALSNTGGQLWQGYLSNFMLINRYITDIESRNTVNVSGGLPVQKTLSLLGDSITDSNVGWPDMWHDVIFNTWQANSFVIKPNHAVGGMGVLAGATNFAVQVSNTINDKPNIIIIALGTNDNDAGDMTALGNAVQSGLSTLKSTNPSATIYWMNVLPSWTDNTGTTPKAKDNIRAAIATACSAQNIVCWDTKTSPWITASQTVDGVHPNTSGHAAIASQILSRI